MSKYELLGDLHDYHKQGAGDPAAFAMACVLLEEFMRAGDEGAGLPVERQLHAADHRAAASPSGSCSSGSGGHANATAAAAARAAARAGVGDADPPPFANFRFAHSETVMPMLSMLGLYQDPGSPSLHDYWTSSLARGTKALLNETRQRLAQISATRVATSWEAPGAEDEAAPLGRGGLGLNGEEAGGAAAAAAAAASSGAAWRAAGARPDDGNPSRVLPFTAAQMLALKHPWSGARLIPMAANVQWLLYDCGDGSEDAEAEVDPRLQTPPATPPIGVDAVTGERMSGVWLKMLHNEREVQLPACAVHSQPRPEVAGDRGSNGSGGGGGLASPTLNSAASRFNLHFPCPWGAVKDHYRRVVYEQHGIASCDAADWTRICGGVTECGEEGDD